MKKAAKTNEEVGLPRNVESEILASAPKPIEVEPIKPRAMASEILVEPKNAEYGPLEIIRRAQETIEAEKEKLRDERARHVLKIQEIDEILGTPTAEAEQPGYIRAAGKKRGRRSSGGSTKDIILKFLGDGSTKKAKEITAAVVKAGKSKVIGAALAGLVKEKKITNPARGQYKLK